MAETVRLSASSTRGRMFEADPNWRRTIWEATMMLHPDEVDRVYEVAYAFLDELFAQGWQIDENSQIGAWRWLERNDLGGRWRARINLGMGTVTVQILGPETRVPYRPR